MLQSALVSAVVQELVRDSATTFQEKRNYVSQFPTRFRELEEQLKYMQSFAADASQRKDEKETVKTALTKLQELIYEADDLVVDCQIREDYKKMKESSCCLSLSEMAFRYKTGKRITEINSQIRRMRENLISYYNPIVRHPDCENDDKKMRWSSQVFDQSEVVGLTEGVKTIMGWILDQNVPSLRLGIVGLGGLGKTTLAKMILKMFSRDVNLSKRFVYKIWVSVSQPVNEAEIMKSMLKQLDPKADYTGSAKGDMLSRICQLLSEEPYLIVLDDVWSIEDGWWERISSGLPKKNNCCIIITSRNKRVVKEMGVLEAQIHKPKLLDGEESWELFKKVAHMSTDDEKKTKLVEVGREIVKNCGGLPLAIKTIGGLLSLVDKSDIEWTRICKNFHENLTSVKRNCSKMGNESVIASLQLSYDELPAHLKQCILCFSIYPEDYEIDVCHLISWWEAEGFVRGRSTETARELGYNYLSELISRCLVEVVWQRKFNGNVYICKVHDMVRALTIKMAREEDFFSFDENGKHVANASSRRLGITGETTLQTLQQNSKLRALLLTTTRYIGFNRNIELAKVNSLRVLDLSYVTLASICVKDLWYWITSLERLAYLNLKGVAELVEVPNSIGKLWGLRVLILRECKNLEKLPISILKLPRLIILDVGNCPILQCLPPGFSNLSNLQELYGFKIVGPGNVASSHLGELKALTELRVLQIDITEESIIQDQELKVLERLLNLRVLSINAGDCEDKNILKKLNEFSPPSSIEELYLKHYFGETTPKWMNPKSLQQLQYLCMEDSRINQMNEEFWGDKDHKWNVKELSLKFCQRLQVSWEEFKAVMPEIRYLEVRQCNLLVSFPCDVKAVGFWFKDEK